MKEKILVVDDEKDILELINYNLSRNGYVITSVSSGEEALSEINECDFDLMILDLMLPGIDGLELCKMIKSDKLKSSLPIIMLTAKSEESDVVAGLELGADDYITKPFSPRVLLSRIRTILRRNKPVLQNDEPLLIERGGLLIDTGRYEVTYKKKQLKLTFLEFKILLTLAKKPGWVMSRYQIVDAARGDGVTVTDRTVDVHIVSLRKKLGEASDYIETVRGVGYKFRETGIV